MSESTTFESLNLDAHLLERLDALGYEVATPVQAMAIPPAIEGKDVQNIDLMNLAGFCRNCLSKWYREEAGKKGIEISDPDAREHVYGMPYSEWKDKYQK